MMWDQLKTGLMALSAPFQILAAWGEATGNCWRPLPWDEVIDMLLLCTGWVLLPPCFSFWLRRLPQIFHLDWNSGFSLVGSLTSWRTALLSRAELWLISTLRSPQPIGCGAEMSACYQACECGFVHGYLCKVPQTAIAIIGFSKKPRWFLKSLS